MQAFLFFFAIQMPSDPSERTGHASNNIHLQNSRNISATTCNGCSKVMKDGVYRAKQHLVGGYQNVIGCKNVPEPIREESREYNSKKKK